MPRPVGTVPRRRLGRELKKLREQSGLTLEEASVELYTSVSSLSRIETAHQSVDIHMVRSMLDLYNAADRWDELTELTILARKPGWWRAYGLTDRGYVPLEHSAHLVREFTMTVVPGLLQTTDYTRALLRTGVDPLSDQDLERQVEVRRHRQRRLYAEEQRLRLETVIDETVLRRAIGGPDVLAGQLDYLLIAAELDTVTLQVLPADTPDHPGLDGSFTVLSFPEAGEPDMAYVEYVTGSAHIEDGRDVRRCRLAFDRLRSTALSPADSVARLEQLVSAL